MSVSRVDAQNSRKAYRNAAVVCGVLAVVGGGAVLSGWLFGIPRLTDFTFDGINMKANAAAALILSGVALLLLVPRADSVWRFSAASLFAAVVSLTGALTLTEHLTGWDLGI